MFFGGRNKALETTIRKITDITNPSTEESKSRSESRIERISPVLVTPIVDGQPVMERSTFGLTKDLSEHGIAVIVSRQLEMGDTIIGLWPTNEFISAATSEPIFFRGAVRAQEDIGAAFTRVGVQLDSVIPDSDPIFAMLADRAKCLLSAEQLQALNNKKSVLV
jgi:hypothetical protein